MQALIRQTARTSLHFRSRWEASVTQPRLLLEALLLMPTVLKLDTLATAEEAEEKQVC